MRMRGCAGEPGTLSDNVCTSATSRSRPTTRMHRVTDISDLQWRVRQSPASCAAALGHRAMPAHGARTDAASCAAQQDVVTGHTAHRLWAMRIHLITLALLIGCQGGPDTDVSDSTPNGD